MTEIKLPYVDTTEGSQWAYSHSPEQTLKLAERIVAEKDGR